MMNTPPRKHSHMTTTDALQQLWEEGRTRFSNLLDKIQPEDLPKKLHPQSNSLGFLIRHVADVELLFAKNVFKAESIQVHAKTVIAQRDTGEWTNLAELRMYAHDAFEQLKSVIANQSDNDWQESITTKEFGIKTKAGALGRITTHTAYHAGQIGLILKYGGLSA